MKYQAPRGATLLIASFYFFYFALIGIYIIFLPKLLTDAGFSATEVGIIYASAPFMRFLLPFIFQHYLQLTHAVYRIALAMGSFSAILLWFTLDSFWGYLTSNLLFGASSGAILPYVESISLQIIPKDRYGKVRLWGSVGFISVALFFGTLLDTPSQGILYLAMTSIVTLIVGFYIVVFDRENQSVDSMKSDNRNFSIVKYWAFWLSAFLLQVSFGGFYNFFTIYETAHGISLEVAGYLWSFGVLCEIVLFYYQGPLLKKNLLTLLKFAIFTAFVRWAILYLFPSSVLFAYLSQSLHAFSFALYYTAVISYVYNLYTQKKLAQQFLLGLTFGLGGSVGALIAGKLYDSFNSSLFGFEAIVALVSLGVLYLHENRKEKIVHG